MIAYLIKSTACLLLLLVVYHAFLEREKMQRFNRYFLIFSLVLSLSIPLLTIEIGTPAISNLQLSNRIDQISAEQLKYAPPSLSAPVDNQPVIEQPPAQSDIPFLLIGYMLVASALLIRFLRNLHLLFLKIRTNEKVLFKTATLVLVEDCGVPHSFFNCIFVDKQLYQSGNIKEAILTHELTHVRQWHSLDILFVELLKVALWFNPVIYFYKKAMQLNHEFLADETVIADSQDISAYQRLLLKVKSSATNMPLTSSIHYSITKKRIVMMTKKSTRLRTVCKQLALIPLLAGLVFAISTKTATAQDVSTMSITELMEAVNKKMESVDELTDNEKEELNALITKIQAKLNPQAPPPRPPKSPEEIDSGNLKLLISEYNRWISNYNNVTAIDENRNLLQNSYENIVTLNKLIDREQDSIRGKDLPAPPIPASPTKRIEAHTKKSPPAPQPPEKVSERNLLNILVNEEGLILIDEEPVPLDKVKAKVKGFITNNGTNPELSDSPQKAIVSIKITGETLFGHYTDILKEVRNANLEIRNAAAQAEFGSDYKALDKANQKKMQEMYPRQISVAVPKQMEDDTKNPPLQPTTENNILNILVNEEGLILMNEEPVPLDRVTAKVKVFITNNGANSELSDSPQKAFVTIKTSKELPGNIYNDILKEVRGAYLKVWNTAAQSEFGSNYKDLDSPNQQKIREMYPQQISTAEAQKAKE